MTRAELGDQWLKEFVPYLLYRIERQLMSRIRRRLRHAGINIGRWRVLSVLRAYGSLNINRIAEITVMPQPSVSRSVTQLKRDRMIMREISESDSRIVQVCLTNAGQGAFTSIYPTAKRHQEVALKGFSPQEVHTLIDFLDRIQQSLED